MSLSSEDVLPVQSVLPTEDGGQGHGRRTDAALGCREALGGTWPSTTSVEVEDTTVLPLQDGGRGMADVQEQREEAERLGREAEELWSEPDTEVMRQPHLLQ